MRLVRIHVDGFGALRDASYELEGTLSVVYGRNEAGKSTLMNFVRYVLFGFPARGAAALKYEPAGGAAHGGALGIIDGAGKEWRLERYEGSSGRGGKGAARVTSASGAAGGEPLLSALLGGMSGELYRSLFAFGLGELQELRTLQADEVASYLYGAGFGAGGAAIRDAEKRLQQRMDELYRPRGRNQPVAVTLKAMDELEADLRRSREDLPRYEALRRELRELDEALAQLAERGAGARERAERLALILRARPTWLELRALEREEESLPVFPAFPEAAVSRWETLAAEREALRAQRERLQLRRSRLAERLEAEAPPAEDAAGRAALLQLLERAPLALQGEREALQLEGERRGLAQRLAGLLRSLDERWDVAALRASPVTVAERERVRGHRERQSAFAQERSRLQAECGQSAQREAEAQGELRQAAVELEAARKSFALTYPWQPETDADGGDPVQQLRAIRRDYDDWRRLQADVVHVREREGDEHLHAEQLQRSGGGSGQRWALAVPLTLLLLGAGLGAWLFASGQRAAAMAAFIALVGAAAVLARPAGRARTGSRRGAAGASLFAERLDALGAESEQLQRRLLDRLQRLLAPAETAAALEPLQAGAAARRAAPGFHAAASGMAAWEQARDWLERSLDDWERLAADWQRERDSLLRRRDRLGELQAAAARAAELRQQAERRLEALETRAAPERESWLAWLESRLLPAHLSPEAALEALQLMEQGQSLLERCDALDARLAALRAGADAYAAEVAARLSLEPAFSPPAAYSAEAAERLGIDPPLSQPGAFNADNAAQLGVEAVPSRQPSFGDALFALRRWKEQDELLQTKREEQRRLAAELEQTASELEEMDVPLGHLEERVRELLAAASARDEQELRLHARLHERRGQIGAERRSALLTLETWLGDRALERLEAELSGMTEEQLEAELKRREDEVAAAEAEDARRRDRRGRVAGELELLETGSGHADRLQQRQELHAQLERQASEWTELALAVALFRRTRELYERDKQPFVLQRASAMFAAMTEGRYSRIVAPLGEQRLLAMRPDGAALDPGQLSRGTAEQLYLAMRFAIAAEYTQEAPPPLLLDDILVNFDEGRMRRTLELLGGIAETHQVLLFTCHPHIVEAAGSVLPRMQLIEL